ncbi:MAG: xanthine dehydrogenase family protein molybdopterin-binding subunit [SAR202 cluster bacterium]|nr:xanthine dehydrogenase family protein molybdopterin-binding subunit [SAR202 cluster bacterium]MDP6715176.1 xanthine dehydrogenase family protein molybdopterin-binding subunit [SAR202 cluster bacterium]
MTSDIDQTSKDYKVIGTSPIRHDGYDKVTGKALFGADMNLPAMLHAKVLRSPHAHAIIKSIDTSRAEAHPGVMAVVTSGDFVLHEDKSILLSSGGIPQNMFQRSSNCLARGIVYYKGHAIAAVAADNIHAAEAAAALIDIEYEVLPAVTSVESALAEGAPQLHENFPGNIASHAEIELGDLDKGFAEADHVMEKEFRTSTVHQGYIEPHSATAWWTPQGKITIWGSSQGHFPIRDLTASVLGVDESAVKVVPMEIGGGFGGKTTIYLEPVAAALSKKAGAPVKVTMSRADVLEASGPTSGSLMNVKMGVTNEGKITAAQVELKFEAGGFPGSPVGGAAACMLSQYDIENLRIDGYDVVDNKPKSNAYRAPGAPIGTFAVESLVDEICEKLSIDKLDFRIMNAAREGTRRSNGTVNPVIGAVEVNESAKNTEHWSTPLEGENKGRGVATGFWMNGSGAACATANVNFNGTVNLTIGSMDIGGTRPNAAMQFAEVLGIPVESINPQVGDTDTIGWTSMTGGSGAAFKTGWASYEAAQDVKRQMIGRAAMIWERPEEEIELVDGVFRHVSDTELNMTFAELAGEASGTGGPIVGSANLNPPGPGAAFATHIVDVEVDPETGKIEILRYTAVQDVGKAIHPQYAEGQIEGGAVQGIGWALNEEYYMADDGRMMNSSLLDYRMPTSLDVPMIESVMVEVGNPLHPYGVRGVGEVCVVPPLGAIANAVTNAIGVRMDSLPMKPSDVRAAIASKSGG